LPRKNGALVRAKFCETQINIHGERLERAALFLFGGDWQKEGGQKKGEEWRQRRRVDFVGEKGRG
jgi:hypothetical protein